MIQVVFKDKVVHIKENYHKDVKLTVKQKYVTDIYKLASHFIPEDVVKTMKIYEIIKKVNLAIASLMRSRIYILLIFLVSHIFCLFLRNLVPTNRCRTCQKTK